MAAPLIRTPQLQGGTLYAFSSAAQDLTKSFNNDNLKFQFSKYVLLDLPDTGRPLNGENRIVFNSIDGAIYNQLNADDNINLAESLQNYALNLETLLLSDDDYDSSLKKSVAERVFFKWLKEVAGIRFRSALNTEADSSVTRFTEQDAILTGSKQYDTVCKYIGDIDVTNNVEKNGHTYSEIYINVPTKNGTTPTVLFESVTDQNYSTGKIVSGAGELLAGRNQATIHPDGLDTVAFYDFDQPMLYTTSTNASWHNQSTANTYYLEPTTFLNPNDDTITKVYSDYQEGGLGTSFTNLTYNRSKLDGIGIDFDPDNYYEIINSAKISTLGEYAGIVKSENYDFNTVLVYYDVYDPNNPTDRATNLYGVMFVDNLTPLTTKSFIQRYKKIKPNPVTGLNGNSYGLKVNLKFDTSIDNVGLETVINDYNTFSMDLFIDASIQLQESAKIFLRHADRLTTLEQKHKTLENIVYSSENVSEIKSKLIGLTKNFNNSQLALADTDSLLNLITSNSKSINQLVSGTVSTKLQYNTEVVFGTSGIGIDKSVPNKIKITNLNQGYYINTLYSFEVLSATYDKVSQYTGDNELSSTSLFDLDGASLKAYIRLKEFENYIAAYTINDPTSDINFYINDTDFKFKTGQVLRFVFPNKFALSSHRINFYSDTLDKFGDGTQYYSKILGSVLSGDLLNLGTDGKSHPIIEVVCMDASTYTFRIDIIR